MNNIETLVYGIVRKHPFIKRMVKTIYQGLFDLLPREKDFLLGDYDYVEGYFFGFHDVFSMSSDDSKVLANKVPFDGRMPKKGELLPIGYFDFKDGKFGSFHKISDSGAWNYHKGCRLQWIDDDRVIFNTAENEKLVSKIININDNSVCIINKPIDAVYKDSENEWATSFCYERLNKCMPGYGYAVNDGDSAEDCPADSGLFLINLKSGESKLLVSLDQLAHQIGNKYLSGYTHFVTHSEFSKDGRYVSFLYRAVPKGLEGMDMHKTWIVVYSMESKLFFPLPTQESGSHYVWNEQNQIIASCVLDGKSCHVLFDVSAPNNYQIIAGNILNSDGHQSFINNKVFVTDTYPDRRRMAKLFVVNCEDSTAEMIGSIYSPKEFQTKDVHCHIACDLHPRVSQSGKYLCFDSPRTGKRSLYVMELN